MNDFFDDTVLTDEMKQLKEKLQPEIAKIATKLLEVGSLTLEKLSKEFGRIVECAGEYTESVKQAVETNGGLSALTAYLWNLEEQNKDVLTLEDVIKWVKVHFDKTRHSAGCLYVFKAGMFGEKEYHVCFLSKENEPLLDGSEAHLLVHAKSIDSALAEQLGNKSMVVFK